MELALYLIGGGLAFWTLFAAAAWLFGVRLDFWPLVLMFVAHWAIYGLVSPRPGAAEAYAVLGWFVLGPLAGAMRLAYRAGAPARNPLIFAQVVLDATVVTGAAVPLALGLLYTGWFILGA